MKDSDVPVLSLVLSRNVNISPADIFRAWTEPDMLVHWFVPKPWSVAAAEVDLRVGGIFRVDMRDPDGNVHPSQGVFLEIIPNRKLVFTDAYSEAWIPSEKPFMTASIELDPTDEGTRYTAIARHWTEEDKKTHEEMGFHEGWSVCLEQLVQLMQSKRTDHTS